MRSWGALLLMLAVMLTSPGARSFSDESSPLPRDQEVTGQEKWAQGTLYLNENLTVKPGGRLALEGVTLCFNGTSPGEPVLRVEAGGELVVMDSTLLSLNGTPYLISAEPGSRLTITNSSVSGAGLESDKEPRLGGLCVATNESRITNSTFTQNRVGLTFAGCRAAVEDCRLDGNELGLRANQSNVTLRRCRLGTGSGSHATAENSTVRAVDSDLNCTKSSCADNESFVGVYWTANVGVFWDDLSPAVGAWVNFSDYPPPSEPLPGLGGRTDASGWLNGTELLLASIRYMGGAIYGPYNISAELDGCRASEGTALVPSSPIEVYLYLDRTPPWVHVEYPEEGAFINTSSLTARGRAWDPNHTSDEPFLDAVEWRLDDGNWSPAEGLDLWSANLTGLTEAQHALTVRVHDTAGFSAQASVRFIVDLTPPLLEVHPREGLVTNGTSVLVTILTDGPVLAFNGAVLPGHVIGSADEVIWSLVYEGQNSALVEAYDEARNRAWAEVRAVRDTLGPEMEVLEPRPFGTVNGTVLRASGKCSDPTGISRVEASTDGQNWSSCTGNESWSVVLPLKEGTFELHVRSFDALGNANRTSLLVFGRLPDTAAPSLTIASPVNGTEVMADSLLVAGSASDPSGVVRVELGTDGVNWTAAAGTGSWSGEVALAPGANLVRARAFDGAGNVAEAAVIVVRALPPPDTSPPLIEVIYPPEGLKVSSGKLLVAGKASDPSGVAWVELSLDGKVYRRASLMREDWSATVELSPGRNTLRIRAQDSLGNTAQAKLTVERQGPAATLSTCTIGTALAVLVLGTAVLMLAIRYRSKRSPARRGREGPRRTRHEEEE